MAKTSLRRPNDANGGRFVAPPLPGRNIRNLAPLAPRDVQKYLGTPSTPSIPTPPKPQKSIRAPERLAERLKGGHVRGILARAGLQKIVETEGRWSYNKDLLTELVQATQGVSIFELLVTLTRAKAQEVEHWPESIKAAEKLELLRSLQSRLQSALSSSCIEAMEVLLQSVEAVPALRAHPDFGPLVSAVEQRLRKLRSLRCELRRAARSSDIVLLAGSLRMAGELGVRGPEAIAPWKEVEVAEARSSAREHRRLSTGR